MTTIRVVCTDQVLTYENTPMIASGGLEENFVQFSFCNQWDGFEKTAVFWRSETEAYHNLLDVSNSCQLPPEVTAIDGVIYLGVFGVDADGRQRTSNVLTYRIEKGAITLETKPSEPTPDIYNQLLVRYQEMKDIAAEVKAAEEAFEEAMTQQQTAHETAVAASQASFRETVTQRQTAHEEAVDADQLAFQESMTQAQEEYEQHILEMIAAGLLPDDSVATEKIKNSAITSEKIANGAVTVEKIADGALSAGNVQVSADTATPLGVAATPNVDAALRSLIDSQAKVGDIKTTARTDLGDKWLLCDGAYDLAANYPTLWSKGFAGINKHRAKNSFSAVGGLPALTVQSCAYGNGYYAAVSYNTLVYTDEAGQLGTWNSMDFASEFGLTASAYNDETRIGYAAGKWVICGQNNSATKHWVAYADALDGPWTFSFVKHQNNAAEKETYYQAKGLTEPFEYDGKIMFVSKSTYASNDYTRGITLHYAKADDLSTWGWKRIYANTSNSMWPGTSNYVDHIYAVKVVNDKLMVVTNAYNQNSVACGVVGYLTFDEDSTTSYLDTVVPAYTGYYFSPPIYHNGHYYMLARSWDASKAMYLWHCETLGEWTKVSLKTNTQKSYGTYCPCDSFYDAELGKYIVLIDSMAYDLTDIVENHNVDITTVPTLSTGINHEIFHNHNGLEAMYAECSGGKLYLYGKSLMSFKRDDDASSVEKLSADIIQVPTISVDSAYVYIKVDD